MHVTRFITIISFVAVSTLLGTSSAWAKKKCTTCCKKVSKATVERLEHAKELLGEDVFKESYIKRSSTIGSVSDFIYNTVQEKMGHQPKKFTAKVSRAVIRESAKHNMDPIFVLAVIETESQFDHEIVGAHGEIGLMQIKPDTAAWVAQKMGIPWKGDKSLKDPAVNIRIGVAYFAMLRSQYNRTAHQYVAAYNMGPGNLQRHIAADVRPSEYSTRVMTNYFNAYSLLLEINGKFLL